MPLRYPLKPAEKPAAATPPGAGLRPPTQPPAAAGALHRASGPGPALAKALVCALALALAACSAPRGLVKLEQPRPRAWEDDGVPGALEKAVRQSVRYYARLPANTPLRYGALVYTPAEMIRSMELFLTLWRDSSDKGRFDRAIRQKFHLFESTARRGPNLFTGYFEPVIPASYQPEGGLDTPLYAKPPNLVEIDLGLFGKSFPPKILVGRIEGGRVVPFYSREEIQQADALRGVATPLAYVNEVDLFFLQIQGSGVLQMDDGRELQVGYDARNGHPYRSIGALLIRTEKMLREEVSMQSIRRYLEQNPAAARAVLFSNPSYTFFRLLEEGPLGNINVPLTPGRSLALDHRLFAKGGLAYLEGDFPLFGDPGQTRPFRRFMLVQDTGGAIRGHGRGDIFFGRGVVARWSAGHLKHPGRLFLLVAKKEFLPPPPQ